MDHFKENPIMPGVLIIEAMVQTSGLIICGENQQSCISAGYMMPGFKRKSYPW